jgi:ketosteroid isomerase-like protein
MGSQGPGELVTKFLATWDSGDVDGMLDLFAEDAVYHNMPIAPRSGSRRSASSSRKLSPPWRLGSTPRSTASSSTETSS